MLNAECHKLFHKNYNNKGEVSSESYSDIIIIEGITWILTSLLSALFGQLSFELLLFCQERLIQVTQPPSLIFKVLSFGESLDRDS
jgi:hypothetical protein